MYRLETQELVNADLIVEICPQAYIEEKNRRSALALHDPLLCYCLFFGGMWKQPSIFLWPCVISAASSRRQETLALNFPSSTSR